MIIPRATAVPSPLAPTQARKRTSFPAPVFWLTADGWVMGCAVEPAGVGVAGPFPVVAAADKPLTNMDRRRTGKWRIRRRRGRGGRPARAEETMEDISEKKDRLLE